MYRPFYGLNELPFKISPDLTFFYKQASREDIANALLYSITRGDGIIKVVGEVGVGKTTMLRLVAEKLPVSYQKIYVSSPNVSPLDFLKFICTELSIPFSSSDTKQNLVNKLQHTLISSFSEGVRVVMLIDEAQSMMVDTLEEVRLLGNLETQTDKLLQIVLFGQPELDVTLNDNRVKPLKDRIANQLEIPPLNHQEVLTYLNYRMRVAGSLQLDVFDQKVSKRVQSISNGLPRAINLLADKLLMAAFSVGDHQVKLKHFNALGYREKGVFQKWRFALLLVFIVFICALGLLFFKGGYIASPLFPSSSSEILSKSDNKALSIGALASAANVSEQTVKELYRLNMLGFERVSTLESSQSLILLEQGELSTFKQQYEYIMSGLQASQQAKVYVLLDLNPNMNKYQNIIVYDASGLSKQMGNYLLNSLQEGFLKLSPRLISVSELKNSFK